MLSISVTDLGPVPADTPGGGAQFRPGGINRNDQIAGTAGNWSYLWQQEQGYTPINASPPSYEFHSPLIDAAGDMAGYYDAPFNPGGHIPYRYAGGNFQILDHAGLAYGTNEVLGMNSKGDAVGFVSGETYDGATGTTGPYQYLASLWNADSSARVALGLPDGSTARAINDGGQIVGTEPGPMSSEGATRPFLLQDPGGVPTILPTLTNTTNDVPVAINNAGWIAGTAGGGGAAGVLWKPDPQTGRYTALPLDFTPVGINNQNVVAGADGTVWSEAGGDLQVNSLLPANSGWVLNTISGINDHNDLDGTGTVNGVPAEPYLLTGLTLQRIVPTSLAWNPTDGGADFSYEITGSALSAPTTIELAWATGTTADTIIGQPAYSMSTATTVGTYGPFHVDPNSLGQLPQGAKYLLAVADPKDVLGNFGPANVKAIPVEGVDLAISIDSSGIIPSPIVPNAPYAGLTLRHVFGTERVDVPVTIDNQGQGAAKGNATVVLYLSTTPDLSGTHVAIDSKPETIDLQASDSMSDTLTGAEIPGSLAVGQRYYLVAELQDPSIQESDHVNGDDPNNVDATPPHGKDGTFEFVGTPAYNETPFTNGMYFRFIEDTLNGNFVLPQPAMADARSFIGHFEGDYLYPYLDPAGIASIGVGINLTDMAPDLASALVKDVRVYYRAHKDVRQYYRAHGFKKLPKSDSKVVSMLIALAGANGPAPSKHNPKNLIASADDQALFTMAFAAHEANVMKAVGLTTWNSLSVSARTALVDVDYNVKHGLAGEFPTLVQDVRSQDFIKAGFDLVDAKRTTQLPGLTARTEADYQALLTGQPSYRTLLVGP